ncbi:MAG: hypothetical protein FWC76_00865 [Defluviitaleaceae bacterium]|nr:hypothetical protein [Defluviitaleaceae bacterium]
MIGTIVPLFKTTIYKSEQNSELKQNYLGDKFAIELKYAGVTASKISFVYPKELLKDSVRLFDDFYIEDLGKVDEFATRFGSLVNQISEVFRSYGFVTDKPLDFDEIVSPIDVQRLDSELCKVKAQYL